MVTSTDTEEPAPLSAGEARDAIFSQHEVLRGLANEVVDRAAGAAAAGGALDDLRVHAQRLYTALGEHMTFEEEALTAALRDVIGWGAVLQAEMRADHAHQRATLASAVSALHAGGRSGVDLAEGVRAFATMLLIDMEREERALLHADLDAIAQDVEGG